MSVAIPEAMAEQLQAAIGRAQAEGVEIDFDTMHAGAMEQIGLAKQLASRTGIDSDAALRVVQGVTTIDDPFLNAHGLAALATFNQPLPNLRQSIIDEGL